MISPQFRPIVGGYERAAERLSAALAARGHTVTVITERRERSWPAQEIIDGFAVKRLWCIYRRHWHTISALFSFASYLILKGRRFHVWHVHQYGLYAALSVALGILLRRPVVLKLTSTGPQGIVHAVSALPLPGIISSLLRRVDAVVATTARIHLLGNGVDTSLFYPRTDDEKLRLRRNLGIEATGLVLFVGRLADEKNPIGVLNAWKMTYPRLNENWKLLLIGDGPLSDRLKSLIETECLSECVAMLGYQANVETWMAATDIYLISSSNEGLSNTMLEAMASGIPVLSTRVSGTVELLEETGAGIVTDIGRMDQLADSIVKLVSDRNLLWRMGQAGRRVVEARYSIHEMAMKHDYLYNQVR
jgi:glycosyltransferase involved in cell wall biosynthesis